MGYACSRHPCTEVDIRDKYKIGVVLGKGSFAQVCSCTKKSTKEVYAVKMMPKYLQIDKHGQNHEELNTMFKNEVAILQSLNHPNIIKLHEFYEGKDFLYAVMDKCDGGELFTRINERRRFNEAETIGLCKQMLHAIAHVHSCGIVHRDIKAENLLFAGPSLKSRLILIDFGMSIKIKDDRYLKKLCGSPHYIAPELILRNYRFQVDMWALGVVLFLMLFGKYPFEGPNEREIVNSILNSQADYRCNFTVSDLAISFINSLFEKNPDDRLTPKQALEHPWLNSLVPEKYSDDSATTVATVGESDNKNQIEKSANNKLHSTDNAETTSNTPKLYKKSNYEKPDKVIHKYRIKSSTPRVKYPVF